MYMRVNVYMCAGICACIYIGCAKVHVISRRLYISNPCASIEMSQTVYTMYKTTRIPY